MNARLRAVPTLRSGACAASKRRSRRWAFYALASCILAFSPALAHPDPGSAARRQAAVQPLRAQASPDPMAGVTTELLGSLPSASSPGYTLVFLRITMQPGANIPAHSHPGDVVVVVQSGKFGTSFVRGEGTVSRAAVGGADPVKATLKAGDSAVLLPGDSLAYGGSAGHTMSNAGDTPLVLLVSALLANGQPGFMFDH